MTTTFVLDFYAGPGAGKSTLATETFSCLKRQGEKVELVREYVKGWAYRNEPIGRWDGLYLLAKQLRQESTLYGKVDVIVTDSPLLLSAVYESKYQPQSRILYNATGDLINQQAAENIFHVPCFVMRNKPYVQLGGYETEEQARTVDDLCWEFLKIRYVVNPVTTVEGVLDTLRCARGDHANHY